MEETHYSTNEELQATLQELADLQSQVLELQTDNERLSDEKNVIFQSLCRQTEKLEDTRSQVESLKLLLHDPDQPTSASSEREQKLVDMLKQAQDEREGLLMKLEELNSDLNEARHSMEAAKATNERLKERVSVLQIDARSSESSAPPKKKRQRSRSRSAGCQRFSTTRDRRSKSSNRIASSATSRISASCWISRARKKIIWRSNWRRFRSIYRKATTRLRGCARISPASARR
jgi:cytospin